MAESPVEIPQEGVAPVFPMSLNESAEGWRIVAGYIDIFVVHQVDGEPVSSRAHVFRLETNEMLFPLAPLVLEEGELCFFATGSPATRLVPLNPSDLPEMSRLRPRDTIGTFESWIGRLLRVLRSERLASGTPVTPLKPGGTGAVPKETVITSGAGMIWVTLDSGKARLAGRKESVVLEPGQVMPLVSGVGLEALEELEVRTLSTAAVLGTFADGPDLSFVHQAFSLAVAAFIRGREAERKTQAVQRNEANSLQFSSSLGQLAQIVDADSARTDDLKWRLPMKRDVIFWTLLGALVLLCLGWFGELIHGTARNWKLRRMAADYRAETLADYDGPIRIGVAAARRTAHDETFWSGMILAAHEINEAGGVMNRPLELVGHDDQGNIDEARRIAQTFADDMTMSAVIGHRFSPISMATAMIYEYYGLLMICPRTTSPELTRQGYRRVFRTNLSGATYGTQMAEFAKRMGFKRVVILYLDDAFGKGVANAFEVKADELNVAIVDRVPHNRSYTAGEMQKRIKAWRENRQFDTIVVATVMPYGAELVSMARDAGIDQPMILQEALDSKRLITALGSERWHDIYVASMFDSESPFPMAKPFFETYQKVYGEPPNGLSAQGYDAVYLLAHAMDEAQSIVPDKVAEVLRQTKEWYGVTGPHSFTPEGEMLKPLQFKTIKDGKYVLVPSVESPLIAGGAAKNSGEE